MHLLRRNFLRLLPALFTFSFISAKSSPLPAEIPPRSRGPHWLERWKTAPRLPVLDGADPRVQQLLAATETGGTLTVLYHGGSSPGAPRTISPTGLFTVDGFSGLYVTAYCHARHAPRTFRVEALEIATTTN